MNAVVDGDVLNDAAYVSFYYRLQEKIACDDCLFDASWNCNPTSFGQRSQWCAQVLCCSQDVLWPRRFFSHIIERLILLKPVALHRLLCAISLLTHQQDLRWCIDGATVRALHAVVGSKAIAAILSGKDDFDGCFGGHQLDVATLTAQAFSAIASACDGQHALVPDMLRVALPMELPMVEVRCDEATVQRLLYQAHGWYPEDSWLFG